MNWTIYEYSSKKNYLEFETLLIERNLWVVEWKVLIFWRVNVDRQWSMWIVDKKDVKHEKETYEYKA